MTKMNLYDILCIALLYFSNCAVGGDVDRRISTSCLSGGSRPKAIGFNLGQSYGTAALAFDNGDLVNAARIDGSTEYIQLLERRIYDTRDIKYWYILQIRLPGEVVVRRIIDFIANIGRFLRWMPSRAKVAELAAAAEVGLLAKMIADLKAATEEFCGIKVTEAIISGVWPVIWRGEEEAFRDIHEATLLAGVEPVSLPGEEPRFIGETEAILTANGEETYKWRQCPGGSKNGIMENTVLISLTNRSRYTDAQCRECDWHCSATQLSPRCRMSHVNVSQGLDSWLLPRPTEEFVELRQNIFADTAAIIWSPFRHVNDGDSKHKTLLLAGEATSDPTYLEIIRRVIGHKPKLLDFRNNSAWWCDDNCPVFKLAVVEEPEFAAARGAALYWARYDGVTKCHDGLPWQKPFVDDHDEL